MPSTAYSSVRVIANIQLAVDLSRGRYRMMHQRLDHGAGIVSMMQFKHQYVSLFHRVFIIFIPGIIIMMNFASAADAYPLIYCNTVMILYQSLSMKPDGRSFTSIMNAAIKKFS